MRKKLRPYQQETVDRLKKHKAGLIGSGLGSGKTLMAIELIRTIEKASRTLVIAPVNTHDQWVRTAGEQFPSLQGTPYLRRVGTPLSDPEGWNMLLTKQSGFYVIGWEAMRGDLSLAARQGGSAKKVKKPAITQQALKTGMRNGTIPPWPRTGTWDMVILDESHRIQNRDSLNKKTLTLIKADRKLALSATAAGNQYDGLWSTLNWLWPEEYRSFWKWAETFLIIQDKYINQYDTVRQITGEKDSGATWAAIPCAVRHRTEDIIDQLPEVIERVVLVPMADVQRRMYDDFEKQAFAWIDGKPEATPLPLTQRIRLRQASLGTLKYSESVVTTERWVRNEDIDTLHMVYDLTEPVEILLDEDDELMAEVREIQVPRVPEFGAPGEDAYDTVEVLYAKVRITHRESEIDFNEHAPQPKLKMIKEILSDLPEDEPVIIYTHSAKWARMAAAELDEAGIYGEARAWTGDLTDKQRTGLKNVFGKMEPAKMRSVFTHTGIRILVAVIPAVAEGIDGWQHVCRCEIWASQSDDGLMNEQAKGRLHRPGQSSPVQRWLLQSEESIDSVVDINLRIRAGQLRSFYRDDKD